MQVNAGRARFTLSTLPRDDFPIIAEGEPDQLRASGGDAAPDHRQDPLRHLDRGNPLLSQRHLRPRLGRGAAGAEGGRHRRPPPGPGDGAAARGRAGHAGRHHPAQMRRRAQEAARRGRRHGPGLALGFQGPLRPRQCGADLQADRRHLPRLQPRHPHRERQAAQDRSARLRGGRGPRLDHRQRAHAAPSRWRSSATG